MKVYLSGPMTGYADFNYPAFHAYAAQLRERGHDVVSPAEQDAGSGLVPGVHRWVDFVRWDLKVMLDCDTIVLMDGWRESKGAVLEHHVASALGFNVLTIHEALT